MAKGKEKEVRTNAMRILEREKIPFRTGEYSCDEFVDAQQCADALGLDHRMVYKTLVTRAASKAFYVFVIPIDSELDLKAAARSVGEKSLEMIHVKELQSVTGYVRGGCTAIGMKKAYVTRIDESAQALEEMAVSAGKIGAQLFLKPEDLRRACGGEFAAVCRSAE